MSGAGGVNRWGQRSNEKGHDICKHSQALKVITRVFSGEVENHCSFWAGSDMIDLGPHRVSLAAVLSLDCRDVGRDTS